MNKTNLDISFIIPSIRTDNWTKIVESIESNIGENSFEVIFVGPFVNLPDNLSHKKNIKTIRDFGCPSRAFQIASLLVEGNFISWVCDDGFFVDGEINRVILDLKSKTSEKLISNWIYTEGDGYLKNDDLRVSDRNKWYKSNNHGDLWLEGINGDWWVMPLFTIKTSYFRFLGGIDCRFETLNYNLHDLAYRAQREDVDKGLELGAVDYLIKSQLSMNEIIDKVKQVFEQK